MHKSIIRRVTSFLEVEPSSVDEPFGDVIDAEFVEIGEGEPVHFTVHDAVRPEATLRALYEGTRLMAPEARRALRAYNAPTGLIPKGLLVDILA